MESHEQVSDVVTELLGLLHWLYRKVAERETPE